MVMINLFIALKVIVIVTHISNSCTPDLVVNLWSSMTLSG